MPRSSHHDSPRFRIRVLLYMAGVLLTLIALVELWPVTPDRTRTPHISTRPAEIVILDEIVATTQGGAPPPPPAPSLPPVEVEDEVMIEETPLLLDTPLPPLPGPPPEAEVGTGNADAAATAPAPSQGGITRAPQPVRTVQPEYTREARRRRIRAEVVIEVTVGMGGRVEAAQILERYELGRNDARTPVATLDYGLDEAALSAARRWLFRPALREGEPVAQAYRLTLVFGAGV